MEIYLLFAKISWIFFILTMVIRPLNDIFKHKLTKWGMRYRNYLGIVAGLAAVIHVSLFVFNLPLPYDFLVGGVWNWGTLFAWGMIALMAIIPPLITSNRYSQKLLKNNWKNVQRLSYVAFVFAGIHVAFISGLMVQGLLPLAVWIVLIIMAKIMQDNKKQLQDFVRG